MVESEIDEYKLDTKEGKSHNTLRISIIENRVKLVITSQDRPNRIYYNLVRLAQLKGACSAFETCNNISEALNIIKNTIESGNIMISEEDEDIIDIKFNIVIGKKKYSPFVIGLPIDNDNDDNNNETKPENNKQNNNQNNNDNNNDNKNDNNYEILPTKFDYQGNKEAELKYGKSMKSTTEYSNPIIEADVKEPNLVIEYIEPILQVHYPDGTTKSTPLPPRFQTADGKKPNISPEQLKSIHDQMTKNFNQSIIDYEKEKSRANSVARKNKVNNNLINSVNNINDINNNINNNTDVFNMTPNNYKSYENNNSANSLNHSVNINNNINAVRSAMKPYTSISMMPNINLNNSYNNNIRQVRTQFNPYDVNTEERNTTGGMINMTAPSLVQRDDVMTYRPNKTFNKGFSDFSTSSVPNKPLIAQNYNYNMIPNATIKTNNINNNNNPLIQEIPKLNNNLSNSYNNLIMLKKGLSKSSSTPSLQKLGSVNQNFYHNTQSQTQYYYGQNQNQNINRINNNINNINLQSQINNINLQNLQHQNPISKINSSHTSFMNYTHNPHSNSSINNSTKINNFANYNFNINNNQNNILSRNHSNITQNNNNINNNFGIYTQSNDELRYQQLMNQRKLQEQQKMILLQRAKMNPNINYNIYNNNNSINNNIINNISRNPNQNQNKNPNEINYAQVNILEQQIPPKNNNNNINNYNQPMNNYRNRNINLLNNQQINRNILKQSHSQQILRQTPSLTTKNEITQQQIALAQMASENPNNINTKSVSLAQRFLDPSGNEETQSQFERNKNATPEEVLRSKNLKIENESEKNDKKETEQKSETSKIQTSTSRTLTKREEENNEEEEDEEEEDPEAEKLFRLENGLIIFRNGLLRGIIHKYKEIDEIVSKIQLKLMAGVKFMLLYRASEHGDKAKIFHEKCDNHKMTLVLVETKKGVRFGGFTTKTWDGNCVKKIDNNAFVFSFDKKKSYDIIKNEFAIGGYPKFGPVFFGCQIRIYDDFFTKGGTTCNRGLNYKTKHDYELNNGEQKYIVKEIEVYDIETIEV